MPLRKQQKATENLIKFNRNYVEFDTKGHNKRDWTKKKKAKD